VLFLSRYRNELTPYFRVALPPADVLEAIINKRQQYELAERVGTPYPRTFYPETMEDVYKITNEIDYPAFIKPYYGHLWRETFGGNHKGFKVKGPQEVISRRKRMIRRSDYSNAAGVKCIFKDMPQRVFYISHESTAITVKIIPR